MYRKLICMVVLFTLIIQGYSTAQGAGQDPLSLEDAVATRLNAGNLNIIDLHVPDYLPEEFSVDVEHDGIIKRLYLMKHSFRSPNHRVILQVADGALVEIDPGPVQTYLGYVEGDDNTLVGATLTERGLHASVHSYQLPAWHIAPLQEDEAAGISSTKASFDTGRFHGVYEEKAVEMPVFDEWMLAPVNPEDPPVMPYGVISSLPARIATQLPAASTGLTGQTVSIKQAEIGFEVDYKAYANRYSSNTQAVQDNIASFLSSNLVLWLRDCQVKHVIGTVMIRTDQASDPYKNYSGVDTSLLYAFRNLWNGSSSPSTTHDLASMHHGGGGGGLAWVGHVCDSYRYALAGANTASGWKGYMQHEVAHVWSLGHGPGRQELNRSGVQYGIMWTGPHDRFTTDEAQYVINHRNSRSCLVDVAVSSIAQMGPYGVWDIASASVGGSPVTIDVLANDRDSNNDDFYIEAVGIIGGKTVQGDLAISSGTGPGGRDQVIYTPPASGTEGTDMFYYNLRDTAGKGGWGKVDIELRSPVITVDLNQTQFNYDIGTPTSVVMSGWTRISPDTTGDVYWSGTVDSRDRGSISGINDINRDFVFSSSPRTLEHKIANGIWAVTLNMGDATNAHDNMIVKAEGIVQHADVDNAAGQFPYANFQVAVTDGSLSIEFSDGGGSDVNWVVTRMSLSKVGEAVDLSQTSYNYDLGTPTSPVKSGWTRISPNTTGDIYWSGAVSSVDRGFISGINEINRDLIYKNVPTTLQHKIANGTWNVTLNMGDASYAHDNMVVKAEGIVQHADVDSAAGAFPYANFTVTVTDGKLSVEFSDNGGSDSNWVVTRMSLSKQ